MAIICTYNFKGIPIQNAYVRVASVTGDKNYGKLNPQMQGVPLWYAQVVVYAPDRESVIATLGYSLPLVDFDINAFSLFYDYLKTLPEFANAVDA